MNKMERTNQDFVAIAQRMLQSSPDWTGDTVVSVALTQAMADQMEIAFINSQLVSKVQRLEPVQKRSDLKAPKKRVVARPQKEYSPIQIPEQSGKLHFFSESWAKSTAGRRGSIVLKAMVKRPATYVERMDSLYSLFTPKELKLLSFSKDHASLEELVAAYVTVDPLYLYGSAVEQRKATTYNNWVGIAISIIINRRTAMGGTLYDKLLKFSATLARTRANRRILDSLAIHCSNAYRFYHLLGDFVIFSPGLFDRALLLKYPQDEISTLVRNLKAGLSKDILNYKKI